MCVRVGGGGDEAALGDGVVGWRWFIPPLQGRVHAEVGVVVVVVVADRAGNQPLGMGRVGVVHCLSPPTVVLA